MSEMEKQQTTHILDTLNKLTEAKGAEFTEGLIAGINIGTAKVAETEKAPSKMPGAVGGHQQFMCAILLLHDKTRW